MSIHTKHMDRAFGQGLLAGMTVMGGCIWFMHWYLGLCS